MTPLDQNILALIPSLSSEGMEALRKQLGVKSKRVSKKEKLLNTRTNRDYS